MTDENDSSLVETIESGVEDQNIAEAVEENESETEAVKEEIQAEDENDSESEESEDNQDKNFEAVDWVKKRLAQKERQVKKRLKEKERELEYLRQQVSSIYQPTDQKYAPIQGQIFDPTTGDYVDEDSVDGKFVKKFQQIHEAQLLNEQNLEIQTKRKNLGEEIEDLKDKYDDLEDVMERSSQNFTHPMSEMMFNKPKSVETFYDLAKNNPKKLVEISKLPAFQQIEAIHFVEFQKATSVGQKLKSNAPKPVTPVKPSTTTFVDKDSFAAILKRQQEVENRRFSK